MPILGRDYFSLEFSEKRGAMVLLKVAVVSKPDQGAEQLEDKWRKVMSVTLETFRKLRNELPEKIPDKHGVVHKV